eukprot:m.116943 g.116943  ORF g.116943 m.116943 type:complete len:358 (+) comp9314_c0_seq3:67-1140(+)
MALGATVFVVACVVGAVAGVLIGLIGVGGIFLVPTLIQFKEVDAQSAIGSTMFSYIFAGLAGTFAYMKTQKISWPHITLLGLGAIPGASVAPIALEHISDVAIKAVLYGFIVVSAVYSVVQSVDQYRRASFSGVGGQHSVCGSDSKKENCVQLDSAHERNDAHTVVHGTVSDIEMDINIDNDIGDEDGEANDYDHSSSLVESSESGTVSIDPEEHEIYHHHHNRVYLFELSIGIGVLLFVIGVGVGFCSALTGSSGPVILLPILLAFNWNIFIALGCAQVIQVPIATAAVVSFVITRPGVIDFELGGVLAGSLVPFLLVGAYFAHKLRSQTLKLVVAVLLVVGGVALLVQFIVKEAN